MSQNIPRHATAHSGAILASGNGDVVMLPTRDLILVLDITAIQGTSPTLDVVVEEYDPASGKFFALPAPAQITSVSTVRHTILAATNPFGPMLRVSWTLGGTATPGFTFTASLMSMGA